jgi:hypothetical protein
LNFWLSELDEKLERERIDWFPEHRKVKLNREETMEQFKEYQKRLFSGNKNHEESRCSNYK